MFILYPLFNLIVALVCVLASLSDVCRGYCITDLCRILFSQEVKEKLKGFSPLMFEDFAEPFQIDLDKVCTLIC